jgi:hypothetical protein
VPAANEGEYYLYNGNYEYYLGPLGANETQPAVVTTTDGAGVWSLITRTSGKSSVVCVNKTGGNSGLHLAGDNVRLVPWTNDAPASLWYIEPVKEFELAIDGYAAVCMPFAMTMPEGVTAYVAGAPVEVEGVTVAYLTECGTVVAPETPVVLAAENGTYMIGVGGEAEAVEENNLAGVLKGRSVSGSNIYKLTDGEFVKRSATSGMIAANTAYYTAESSAANIALQKGDATSVEQISTNGTSVKFYDLKGNLVEKPVRGIYVTSEGKKVLVK